MHFCIYVKGCKQRIERWCRGMHHKRIIQTFMIYIAVLPLNMLILLMNLRCLWEARLLLMNGLRYQDTRIIRTKFQKQRTAVFHHRDKLFIADPSGIKEDIITEMSDFIDYLTRIINGPVIRSQLNNRQPDRPLCLCFLRIFFSNQLANIFFIKAMF